MKPLQVSGAVRPLYGSLGVKGLKPSHFNGMDIFREWKRGDDPKGVMKWRPRGRRKRGRPKLTWVEGIKGLMGEKGINPLTPNDHYSFRTAPLTSKRFILYIYSTNIGTEYFKHGIYSPCFLLQNAVCFIILTYLVPALFIFYIQGVPKLKK